MPRNAPSSDALARYSAADARSWLARERADRQAQLRECADSGQQHHDQLMAAQITSLEQALEEIDRAEQRLAAGTYGSCERCGEPVPAERLEILPYARCCVGCQQAA